MARYLDQFGNVAEFEKDVQSFGDYNRDGSFSLWHRLPEPYASGPELLEAAKRMVKTYINMAAPPPVILDHFNGPIEELAAAGLKAEGQG